MQGKARITHSDVRPTSVGKGLFLPIRRRRLANCSPEKRNAASAFDAKKGKERKRLDARPTPSIFYSRKKEEAKNHLPYGLFSLFSRWRFPFPSKKTIRGEDAPTSFFFLAATRFFRVWESVSGDGHFFPFKIFLRPCPVSGIDCPFFPFGRRRRKRCVSRGRPKKGCVVRRTHFYAVTRQHPSPEKR